MMGKFSYFLQNVKVSHGALATLSSTALCVPSMGAL
jgi:hypothetical protein